MTISTAGEKAQAFVLTPLPPQPPIDWNPKLHSKFDQALLALTITIIYFSPLNYNNK